MPKIRYFTALCALFFALNLNAVENKNLQENSAKNSQNLSQNSQKPQPHANPQNTAILHIYKDTNLSEIYDLNETKNSQARAKLEAFLREKCYSKACHATTLNNATLSNQNATLLNANQNNANLSQNSANLAQNSQQNATNSTQNSQQNLAAQNGANQAHTEHNLKYRKLYKGDEKYDFAAIFMQDFDSEGYDFMGIRPHDTNYFLPFSYNFARVKNGEQHLEVKFQLSIKKAMFEDLVGLGETWNLGFTQRAWWQLYAHSAPFRELNYAPEAFVSFPLRGFGWLKTLNIGVLHQSNGRDGLSSRSWNRVYGSFMLAKSRFIVLARLWYILPEKDSDNPDIKHYLGNFDLRLGYLGRDLFAHLLLRNNLNFAQNTNSVQLDVGYDIFNNGIFWYLQYFNGYGESLIDYNRHANRLSVGFLIAY